MDTNAFAATAIAIGRDGLPLAAYQSLSDDKLKFAHCGTIDCSKNNTLTSTENRIFLGGSHPISLVIGTDGLPLLAYQAHVANELVLKVTHCGNAYCSAANLDSIVSRFGSENFKGEVSIDIGRDGLPVVSFFAYPDRALRVMHCGNAFCSTGNVHTTIDDYRKSGETVGQGSSIAIGTDGLPVVSYIDDVAGRLKIAHCQSVTCATGAEITSVDTTIYRATGTDIAIGGDGLPVVSYTGYATSQTQTGVSKVLHCGDRACARNNTFAILEGGTQSLTMTMGSDGAPWIIHEFSPPPGGSLPSRLVHCGNASCSTGNTANPAPFPQGIFFFALAIAPDGRPVMSYVNGSDNTLRIFRP